MTLNGVKEKKNELMLLFSDQQNVERNPTDKEEVSGWKRVGSLCHRSSSFLEICKSPTVGCLNSGKNLGVQACFCIARQWLEQAEVTATVLKDSKGDITCRGEEVLGLVRSGGGEGEGRKSRNV